MNDKKRLLLIVVLFTMCLFLAACSSNSAGDRATEMNPPPTSTEPLVELTWYYPINKAQPDQQEVEDAVNRITKKKIHAIVHLKPVPFDDYEMTMNKVLASGQSFDIAWTSGWLFNYIHYAMNGAFLPIDNLLENYGQAIKAQIPEYMWADAKINGKLYFVPNYQVEVMRNGFVFLKQLVEKYNFDVTKVKDYQDIEPFLAEIKQNEPNYEVFQINQNGFFSTSDEYWGHLPALGLTNLGAGYIKKGDDSNTLLENIPEFESYIKLARSWYLKGYIRHDILTNKNLMYVGSKPAAVTWDWTLKPGGEVEDMLHNGGNEVIYVPITKPIFTGVTNTMNAISRTSAHPDRAMQLLDLVNSDSDLFNLLAFGIEGKHYTKLNDNTIRIHPDGGYSPNEAWVFGDVFNGYLQEGQAPDTWEVTKRLNETAEFSPYLGYVFDPAPVKAEVEAINKIGSSYMPLLLTGAGDPNILYPEMQAKLKAAGVDRVVQESQRQLNTWLKDNGKW